MRQLPFIAVTISLASIFTSDAIAQAPAASGGRPTFSPYLNLLRGGNPVLNYYGIVRPEQEFRSANQQFYQSFNQVDQRFNAERDKEGNLRSQLEESGHRVRFMSDLRGGAGGFGQMRGRVAKPGPGLSSRLSTTGHSAYFGNRGSYFPSLNGKGPGAR